MAKDIVMPRDASNCMVNGPANYSNLPISVEPHFFDNTSRMCGFQFPNSLPAAANLTECCDSGVEVYNGCFHYCITDLQWAVFGACVTVQLNSTGQLQSTEFAHVDCNIHPRGNIGMINSGESDSLGQKVKSGAARQSGSRSGLASWWALSVVVAVMTVSF